MEDCPEACRTALNPPTCGSFSLLFKKEVVKYTFEYSTYRHDLYVLTIGIESIQSLLIF